ncbi:MAG TPA: GH92 family glycosyl hydrolase [Agriterribacter sp.]|nr:GH92 family glycosyl hydrolase [Agriterribacter sp.]
MYVNPFIGTDRSDVYTRWGSEGGTYPGAVAPSGFMQLSPETSVQEPRGYYYRDNSIYFFSCTGHHSGFPGGSSGQLAIMTVGDTSGFTFKAYKRKFSHKNENASPGYYSVVFDDDQTKVEATASTRSGIFRFTFPSSLMPHIFIEGESIPLSTRKIKSNRYSAILEFSKNVKSARVVKDGTLYSFSANASNPTIIELKLSISAIGCASAQRNFDVELKNTDFEKMRKKTMYLWNKALSVIDIEDTSMAQKTTFYTALYHSLLIPWIISDVDGNYMGRDRKTHKTKGRHEYGGFSPWDSFRSLHPLITLLFPDKQKDMVLSMLDIYLQTGNLPTESMTGNHAVSIITDSYLKGIIVDSAVAYAAMKSNIAIGPFRQKDMTVYHAKNYIPFTFPESVTRTTEYAYNDWALAQYAKQVMHNEEDYHLFLKRSYNYYNLFNSETLFLLPRNLDEVKREPGNTGYKEGDKWIYTYFVPQHPKDLVNLLGGDDYFSERLDDALDKGKIVFDNETVFHLPYFFDEASHSWLTQKWVSKIIRERYHPTPGGLPGNDDLGAASSWYVFSALGIYPFCPGKPYYSIGSPIFRSAKINLPIGKKLAIRREGDGIYVKSCRLNGVVHENFSITHHELSGGGELVFTMSTKANVDVNNEANNNAIKKGKPAFSVSEITLSKQKASPNESVQMHFTIRNDGARGTKVIALYANGKMCTQKNCFVEAGTTIRDSIEFRLYSLGNTKLSIDGAGAINMEIITAQNGTKSLEISNLVIKPLLHKTAFQDIAYSAKNIGGVASMFIIPVKVDNVLLPADSLVLEPGEEKKISKKIPVKGSGLHQISVDTVSALFKIYDGPISSVLLDLSFKNRQGKLIRDMSGFNNQARLTGSCAPTDTLPLIGNKCFVEVAPSLSLDSLGEDITMMAWIFTTGGDRKTVDLVSKGDYHVIQVSGNRSVKFFAGGWSRGECVATLPVNWKNQWHHVAGTCDGSVLKVYIDGVLKTTTPLNSHSGLSSKSVWNIGSNEEFPGERVFEGYVNNVKIFGEVLSEQDVKAVMEQR